MRNQRGSATPIVLLVMLSAIVFAYYSYDMSRSYLAAKVQINTASELNDLTAITGDSEWNVEKQVAESNGLDVNGSNDDWTFEEHDDDEVVYMTTSLPMQQHRKLTPGLSSVGNDSFTVSAKTIRAKHYEDLNVIIAISNDPRTRSIASEVKYEINDALKSLFDKTNSTLTVIPYGYRINISGKCWSTFPRGDNFPFQWWERYFGELDVLKTLENQKSSIENNISNANSQIAAKQRRINEINELLAETEDPEEKDQLEAERERLEREIDDLYEDIEEYESDLEDKEEQIEDQEEVIAELESSPIYEEYKDLAYHYAKPNYGGANYLYLDNYFDEFLESNGYSYTDGDAISDSKRTNMASVDELKVTRNKYFGNSKTCPSQQALTNSSDYSKFLSIVNSMDFSDSFVSPIQGFNYSLKKAFNLDNKRTVVINITSLDDTYLSEQDQKDEDKDILSDFCSTVQNKYVNDVSAKSIFIIDTNSNLDDIEALDCTNAWNKSTGIIDIDEIDEDEKLTDRISYELLQESSSTYIGNEDDEE
ncbi:hypothetical protein ACOMICROBIO_LMKGKHOH_03761 [Vibrio sp. B1FIG11]|uniref:hypothetical protein n=1 Tax=Vibrio sp. B1FIG11 TaxID=2751177 RepID=UPI001AF287B4|nr:hypothetical protein [Vibrio sp. B1FIG11]CAD7826312.1 hypothetical protein ACOMICROBIO_LMKGKHOH_03761 [Vibrio sp. B1FIG11]CAE6959670.1 hypothetical protein ACOMICROBIO_LMKGKHOH_03761 [Vibrio sp. B1FIG11]